MLTLLFIKEDFFSSLQHLDDEVEPLFYYALESIEGLKRSDFILNPNIEVDNQKAIVWQNLITHLKQNKPIQYFFGTQNFYGLDFFVNEHTLIPRPETEELVDWIIQNHQNQKLKILDIGTGSGCIAITLAKHLPKSNVFAMDISKQALVMAKKNASNFDVKVDFIQKDILSIEDLADDFDVIVSNPPYVRNLERKEILPHVLAHEPHQALFVPDDKPLLFYDKILGLAKKQPNNNVRLYFEINQYLGKEMFALFRTYGYKEVTLKKDFKGNDRMISNAN